MTLLFALLTFGLIGGLTLVLLDRQARHRRFTERLARTAGPPDSPKISEPNPVPSVTPPPSLLQHLLRWVGRGARRRRFDSQIPDTLLLIVAALRAGHSPARAVQMVAEEMPPPTSEEFATALGEIGLGLPAAAALARISGRVHSPDWDLVVTAVTTQLQTGGNLAEILERIAGTVRERVRVQGEVASLTAEGKFSALILGLLPPVLALLLLLRDPRYFHPLTDCSLGRLLIAGAVTGQLVGALILQRMLVLDV